MNKYIVYVSTENLGQKKADEYLQYIKDTVLSSFKRTDDEWCFIKVSDGNTRIERIA